MNAKQRDRRDAGIATLVSRGHPPTAICDRFGLSERRLRPTFNAQRAKRPRFFDPEAHEALEEMIDRHWALYAEFALIGVTAPTAAQRMGALNGKVRVLGILWRLYDEAGLIPHFVRPPLEEG